DFVKSGRVAQRANKVPRLLGGFDIQGDNQRRLLHMIRSGFDPRSRTEPIRYAPGKTRSRLAASRSAMLISNPPDVWGSYSRSGTYASDSTHDSTNSRLFLRPPGI